MRAWLVSPRMNRTGFGDEDASTVAPIRGLILNGDELSKNLEIVHPANVQDRDGAPALLKGARRLVPWLRHVFADGGYAGDKLKNALKSHGDWRIEIVKQSDAAKGFVLLPRRWVVERTLAWLNRNRRLAKDVKGQSGARQPGSISPASS